LPTKNNLKLKLLPKDKKCRSFSAIFDRFGETYPQL